MKKTFFSLLGSFAPFVAFAQVPPNTIGTSYIFSVQQLISGIISWLFPVLTSLAILWFIWSVIQYIRATDKDKDEKKKGLLWSLIGLFVILSVMGIIRLVQNITGTGGSQQIQTSQVPSIIF